MDSMLFLFVDFDRSTGRAGVTATVCDIKLVNWDEGNYKVTDKPNPRGEIYVGKLTKFSLLSLLLLFLSC